MVKVRLPDGNMAEFPDDMPPEKIQDVLNKQYGKPATADQSSFGKFVSETRPDLVSQVKPSSFMDGVEAFNRQFGRMAEGVLDLATWGDVNKAVRQTYAQNEASLRAAKERSPRATTVGTALGAVGSGVAYGGLGVGAATKVAPGLASKVAQFTTRHPLMATEAAAAGGAAAMGYLDYAPTQQERLTKGATAGAIGAALPVGIAGARKLGSGIGKGLSALNKAYSRFKNPKQAMLSDLAETIKADLGDDAADTIRGLLQPAKNLKTTRTPGQAVGGLTRARELSQIADLKAQTVARKIERTQSKETLGAMEDMLEKMAPKGTAKLKTQLYDELADVEVSDDILTTLKSNPVINEQLTALNLGTKVTRATRHLPDNSALKLDIAKQEIDDMLYRDARAIDPTNKMGAQAKLALQEARNEITDTLDPIIPQYASARKAAQKLLLRDRYEKLLLKKGAKAGQKGEKGIDETWQVLFPTEESQQVFINDVAKTGGNPQQAADLLTAMDQLRLNTLKRIYSRPTQDDPMTIFYGNKIGYVQKAVDKLTGGRLKKAILNLTFDGNKWGDEIQNVLSKPDVADQHVSLLQLMSKAAKEISKPAIELGRTGAIRGAAVQGARGIIQEDDNKGLLQ